MFRLDKTRNKRSLNRIFDSYKNKRGVTLSPCLKVTKTNKNVYFSGNGQYKILLAYVRKKQKKINLIFG